jgi:glycosyltransferase involved in cell wall biosynthesis
MTITDKGVLRVCYFGTYSMQEGYPRNRVIIEGLRRNGVEVFECHEDFWNDTSQKLKGVTAGGDLLRTISRLLITYVKLIYKFIHAGYYDVLIVGYAGHIDVFLAKVLNLFKRKPIIFDAFLSLYDTAVMDRQIVRAGTVKAKLLKVIDTWSCRIADAVLLDTKAHVDYFVKEFGLPTGKFYAVPVGSALAEQIPLNPPFSKGETSFSPFSKGGVGGFEILYFGSYIPLHGVDVIIKAAKILQNEKDIVFTLIGKGQLLPSMKQLASELGLKNINFIDRFVEEKELVKYIQRADICLGIFGQTEKALRVIPCKVYNCLQMGKPLITGRTEAAEGILFDRKNALLSVPGDPGDLAKNILELKHDSALRERIANNGTRYFSDNFSYDAIGKKVVDVINLCEKA